MLGDRRAGLRGVLPVVEPDAEDVARLERGEPLANPDLDTGVAQRAEQFPFEPRGAAVGGLPGELDAAVGGVADDPQARTKFRVTRQPNATSIPLRAGDQYKDSSQSAYREPQCGRHGFPL